ncbi:MAG: NAD(P)/FAD-dependent oxidoreductase [Phycisphaerales bacterium]|nr:NAD(P)/FAD-dependent oxidoreductase [Phycisphaerales bacterium]
MVADRGRPGVLIVGGGFAGIACARALRNADVDIVLIDRRNHHLFQPLLYQVATAALSPANIATPIRKLMRRQKNCTVVMGNVDAVDLDAQTIDVEGHVRPFDYIVLACGMTHNYFGNDEWEAVAPGLKTVDDALEMRRRVLLAFEAAELETDDRARRAQLTFVIVGGGPTGVELAGAIAEIASQSIPRDFRRVDTREARVVLVEAQDRLLQAFHPELSDRAKRDLERLGVEVRLGTMVSALDRDGVTLGEGDNAERIESTCALWAAGLKSEPVADSVGTQRSRDGRIRVNGDLSIPGYPFAFATGDLMAYDDPKLGREVPGVAQGALQSGAFVGRVIAKEISGGSRSELGSFHYFDKGSMATIGRARAVAEVGSLRFGGFFAWLLWSVVHILFLIGFRNKLLAVLEWSWLYIFWNRGARLITGERAMPKPVAPMGADGV